MTELRLGLSGDSPVVVCLGAHSDDIEIGAGGLLARLANSFSSMRVYWIVFSGDKNRQFESRRAARLFCGEEADIEFHFLEFRDGYLPYEGARPKEELHALSESVRPDLVLTHCLEDQHQDHRHVAEITWNIFRNNLILEYEIPKYESDLGHPNLYVTLSEEEMQAKVDTLLQSFVTQREKHWFTPETFRALARLRGLQAGRESPFAEAFYVRKVRLDL